MSESTEINNSEAILILGSLVKQFGDDEDKRAFDIIKNKPNEPARGEAGGVLECEELKKKSPNA